MDEFVLIVNSLGFPIAVCIGLFWFNQQILKTQSNLLTEFKEILRDNTKAMRDNHELTKILISEIEFIKEKRDNNV